MYERFQCCLALECRLQEVHRMLLLCVRKDPVSSHNRRKQFLGQKSDQEGSEE